MSEANTTPNRHFLSHPEVEDLLGNSMAALVAESDRGAVLIAAAHVDNHLRKLFEAIAPSGLSRETLRTLLDYPGALSSLSAKTEIALLCRLITPQLAKAIRHLRKLRNTVAHAPDTFKLSEHEAQVRRVYELGPDVPVGINRWALEAILKNVVHSLLELEDPVAEVKKPMFESPKAVLDYLSSNKEMLKPLEEQRPRWELGIAVAIVCGLIVLFREKASSRLGDCALVSSL